MYAAYPSTTTTYVSRSNNSLQSRANARVNDATVDVAAASRAFASPPTPRMRTAGRQKQYAAAGAIAHAFNPNAHRHPIAGVTAPPNAIPNATPNGTHA